MRLVHQDTCPAPFRFQQTDTPSITTNPHLQRNPHINSNCQHKDRTNRCTYTPQRHQGNPIAISIDILDTKASSSNITHRIETGTARPVHVAARRRSPPEHARINQAVTEMLERGIIEPSCSEKLTG